MKRLKASCTIEKSSLLSRQICQICLALAVGSQHVHEHDDIQQIFLTGTHMKRTGTETKAVQGYCISTLLIILLISFALL